MGNRQTGKESYKGIAVQAPEFALENITAQGTGLTDSSFSQAGPRPGAAVATNARSKLDPQISGGQTREIQIKVRRGDLPGPEGVGLVWRGSDEDADDYAWRGRPPPNFANHWIAAEWTDADTYDVFDLAVNPVTGTILLAYADSSSASDSIYVRRFEFPEVSEDTNPQEAPTASGEWSSRIRASRNPLATSLFGDLKQWLAVSIVALPSGRFVVYGRGNLERLFGYYSDDDGASWAPYGVAGGLSTLTSDRLRTVYYRGEVLQVINNPGAVSYEQFASNSLGTKFESVEFAIASETDRSISLATLPGDQGIVCAYIKATGGTIGCRVLSSAYQPLSTASEIVVSGGAVYSECEIVSDGSGRLFIIARQSGTIDKVDVYVSTDGAATWAEIDGGPASNAPLFLSHDNGARITNFAAAMVRGWCVLAHNWVASVGNEDGSIGTLWSGGFGSVSTNNASPVNRPDPFTARPSWGETSSGTSSSRSANGIPIELPADVGPWTHVLATAPTLASPGVAQFVYGATAGAVRLDPAGTAGNGHTMLLEVRVTSGSTNASTIQAGGLIRVADGTVEFQASVRLDTTNNRILIQDDNGATIGTIDPWDCTEWTQIMFSVTADGNLIVAYRRPWHTRWLKGPSLEGASVLTDAGPGAANNRVQWGAVSAITATVQYRQWHHTEILFGEEGFSFGLPGGTNQTNAYHRIGAVTSAFPEAIPEVGEQGVNEAFLAATRGPGITNDSFLITPVYDHGIDKLFPNLSPSPGETWRSADLSTQRIVFDFGIDTRFGPIWHALFGAFNTNVDFINFRTKTAAAGAFTLFATYQGSQGFSSGLTYVRNGNWIRPAVGTGSGARFLERNELRGGWVNLDLGGTNVSFMVEGNGPGVWADPTTPDTLFAEIKLSGSTLASAPASGSCRFVFPNGVRPERYEVVNPPTEYFRYLMVEIAAQTVPTDHDYYEIGNLFVGSTAVFGKRWSRGWSQALVPNTSRRVSRAGVVRKRRDGVPAKRWVLNWADGVTRARLLGTARPDYISLNNPLSSIRTPVAAVDDVIGTLFAILDETDGTEFPVIGLNSIPDGDVSDQTINNPRRFIYGTIDANAQRSNVTGEEETNEFDRIEPITISELVKL